MTDGAKAIVIHVQQRIRLLILILLLHADKKDAQQQKVQVSGAKAFVNHVQDMCISWFVLPSLKRKAIGLVITSLIN
jgi:hypothetical protein